MLKIVFAFQGNYDMAWMRFLRFPLLGHLIRIDNMITILLIRYSDALLYSILMVLLMRLLKLDFYLFLLPASFFASRLPRKPAYILFVNTHLYFYIHLFIFI